MKIAGHATGGVIQRTFRLQSRNVSRSGMEKIKRNSGRVDIAKLTETENAGDDLTGGYIFKIDKNTGSSGTLGWTSKVAPPQLAPPTIANSPRTYYYYEYPKAATITYAQQQYLKAVGDTAEAVLNGSKFNDPGVGYKKYFDPQSFAKYFLLNEFSKSVVGSRWFPLFYRSVRSQYTFCFSLFRRFFPFHRWW